MGRYSKKFVLLLVVAAVACQACPCAAADGPQAHIGDFKDISQSDWCFEYVKRLYEEGIIKGVAEDSYAPEADVKASELSALIARYLGLEHMAERCKDFLVRNKVEGAGLWYSGYIQLMCDLGIFEAPEMEAYGIKLLGGGSGGAAISGSAAALIDAPIKRMDVAKFVAKSFEIKKGRTRTNFFLKSEIGGNGNEFITGGGYSREILDRIEGMIGDYSDIPESYREYFLKCHYNGIMRGNEKGEALPENNLTRGELARIIASVLHFDLRDADLRELPSACVVGQGDYYVSPANGSRSLKTEKAGQILSEQAKNIKTENLQDSVEVSVRQENIIPAGYLCEIYVYAYENGTSAEIGRMNCATATGEYFPKEASFAVPKANGPGQSLGCVYLVLRDLSKGGEIAGALTYAIGEGGNLEKISAHDIP